LADYYRRQLSVDYTMSNEGSGIAIEPAIQASFGAPTTVYVVTALPLAAGSLGPTASTNITLKYYVPSNVYSFVTTTYASCEDDAGRLYWFPRQLPQ